METDGTPISIRTGSWCGDCSVTLHVPSHWHVNIHDIASRPALSEVQIADRVVASAEFRHQVSGLTKDAKVAIVVDDHSRPTPHSDILPPLLEPILAQGVRPEQIKIVVAVGTHVFDDTRLMTRKLGAIPDGIEVIMPDCRRNQDFVFVGHLDSGVPVNIHKDFASADLKIAISGVYPHDEVSFSGGAKILIGILGLETISRIHQRHGLLQRGSVVDTDFRLELENLADLVALDYNVNCIINREKRISVVHAGDFREAFRAAVRDARECFATAVDPTADIVLSNAYPLDTALCVLGKSKWPFAHAKPGACRILLTALCDCPAGRIPLAPNRRDRFKQAFKRRAGLSAAKQSVHKMKRRLELRRNPLRKWDGPCVVYVTHTDPLRSDRPAFVDYCPVEYDWENVIREVTQILGSDKPVRVSVYARAPLLFPHTSGQNGARP